MINCAIITHCSDVSDNQLTSLSFMEPFSVNGNVLQYLNASINQLPAILQGWVPQHSYSLQTL